MDGFNWLGGHDKFKLIESQGFERDDRQKLKVLTCKASHLFNNIILSQAFDSSNIDNNDKLNSKKFEFAVKCKRIIDDLLKDIPRALVSEEIISKIKNILYSTKCFYELYLSDDNVTNDTAIVSNQNADCTWSTFLSIQQVTLYIFCCYCRCYEI